MKRIAQFILLLSLGFMTAQGQEIERFVTTMLEKYPSARLLDIYKSSFQDFMGAEHLVGDSESARAYLEQELATINATALQPWYYEPCGVEGRYVRVSLLAVIDGKVPMELLLDAFIHSANSIERPSVEQWNEHWQQMLVAIDAMKLDLPHQEEDKAFIQEVLSMGKYAISHSPEYREAYSPHYRIVKREIFENELLPLIDR